MCAFLRSSLPVDLLFEFSHSLKEYYGTCYNYEEICICTKAPFLTNITTNFDYVNVRPFKDNFNKPFIMQVLIIVILAIWKTSNGHIFNDI
jgi:hypothetical protein